MRKLLLQLVAGLITKCLDLLFVCSLTWRLQDSQLDQLHHQNLWPSYFPVHGLGPAALKRICFPSSKEPSDDAPEIHIWWTREEISYLWYEWEPSRHSWCDQGRRIMAPVALAPPQTARNCVPGARNKYENQGLIFHNQVPEEKSRTSLPHGVLPICK